jgi:hypothetical protein
MDGYRCLEAVEMRKKILVSLMLYVVLSVSRDTLRRGYRFPRHYYWIDGHEEGFGIS